MCVCESTSSERELVERCKTYAGRRLFFFFVVFLFDLLFFESRIATIPVFENVGIKFHQGSRGELHFTQIHTGSAESPDFFLASGNMVFTMFFHHGVVMLYRSVFFDLSTGIQKCHKVIEASLIPIAEKKDFSGASGIDSYTSIFSELKLFKQELSSNLKTELEVSSDVDFFSDDMRVFTMVYMNLYDRC